MKGNHQAWADNMERHDMDIERFAPNAGTTIPSVIATLPTTIELTGFSDRRHYLEQYAIFGPSGRQPPRGCGIDIPALDSQITC